VVSSKFHLCHERQYPAIRSQAKPQSQAKPN